MLCFTSLTATPKFIFFLFWVRMMALKRSIWMESYNIRLVFVAKRWMADVKGHKYLCRMPFSQTACLQCDQIGLFMRILGDKISDKISNKMSPKDWQCFGLFCKNLTLLCKNCCGYFWGCFGKVWAFILQHLVTLLACQNGWSILRQNWGRRIICEWRSLRNFIFLNGPFPDIFSVFSSFQYSWQ